MAMATATANMHLGCVHAAPQPRLPCRAFARTLRCAQWSPKQHSRSAVRVEAAGDVPERGSGAASTSGADNATDAAAGSQLLWLRKCGWSVAALAAVAALLHGDAALAADPTELGQHHHAANAVFDLAAGGEEDFWGNVANYARFFVTVMLGTVNVVSQPFRKAAKKPGTAIALVLGSVAVVTFMAVTVKMMLGVGVDDSDLDYLSRGI